MEITEHTTKRLYIPNPKEKAEKLTKDYHNEAKIETTTEKPVWRFQNGKGMSLKPQLAKNLGRRELWKIGWEGRETNPATEERRKNML